MAGLTDDDFSAFVRARGTNLASTAAYLTGSVDEAEDVLQQALVDTYARLGRIREPVALETYVRTAMVRGIVSGRYSRWRRHEVSSIELIDVDPDRSPVAAFKRVDDRDLVWQLLQSLTPKQRAVVVLRYFDELSEAEIAAHLGCSKGSVKTHASRALARIREGSSADQEGVTRE